MPPTPTFKPNWRFKLPLPDCPVAACIGTLTEDWVMHAWDCHTCGGRFSDMYLHKLDRSHLFGTAIGRMSSKQSNVSPGTAKQYKSTWRRPECPIAGCNSGILVPIIGTDQYECNLCNTKFSDSFLKLLRFSYVYGGSGPGNIAGYAVASTPNQTRKATPMPQNTRVKIIWDDSVAAFRVATPYNPQFVDLLKNLIPIADRVWDPQSKIWTIGEKYGAAVKQLCISMYGASEVTFVDRAAYRTATATQAAQAQAQQQQYAPPPVSRRGEPIDLVMLNFVKVLPYEAAQAAYRKAAMALHPDRNNGDASKMTLLNTTWSRIEKEFYGRVS